jgi:hypothetical protein
VENRKSIETKNATKNYFYGKRTKIRRDEQIFRTVYNQMASSAFAIQMFQELISGKRLSNRS